MVRFKARLVAREFQQILGIVFSETFAPVVRFPSIRMIFSISAKMDYPLHQMDVKAAFLNGDLEEIVYMEQPEGFISAGNEDLVCRLKKELYGICQASRQWHGKIFSFFVKEMKLEPNDADGFV